MAADLFQKLDLFFEQFPLLSFKKHEIILHAQDTPAGVYYLQSGYVRLYSTSHEGEELTLLLLSSGDFFPTRWAIVEEPIEYYIQAITPVIARRAPKEKFLTLLSDQPEALYEFTRRILLRMGGLFKRMEHLAFGNAYTKIASILLILAGRFGEKQGTRITIQIPLTHKEIASLVGMARETASVELELLMKKRLISLKGHRIVIENMEQLHKEALLPNSS